MTDPTVVSSQLDHMCEEVRSPGRGAMISSSTASYLVGIAIPNTCVLYQPEHIGFSFRLKPGT